MDESVTSYPSKNAQRELAKHLWPANSTAFDDGAKIQKMKHYLHYYLEQCELFDSAQRAASIGVASPDTQVRTHKDVAGLADLLHQGALDRDDFHQRVGDHYRQLNPSKVPSQSTIDLWLKWIARLITMIEIGQIPGSFTSNKPQLWWSGTLHNLISGIFTPAKTHLHASIKLEKAFNAVALERIAGMRVAWTSDLANHLSLRDDDKTLLLFHHVTFLKLVQTHGYHRLASAAAGATPSERSLFPEPFLAETLQTLALLLPWQERDVRRWLNKQNLKSLDPEITSLTRLRADDRQIEKFHYWRERLTILKEVFDDAEPGTLSQWWYDRRKGPQWYTFWVAIVVLILTIFFGLVQSVEGALQVWLAWKQAGSG